MPVDINPLFAVGPVPECRAACLNGGYCAHASADQLAFLGGPAGGGALEYCVCPPNLSGPLCEDAVRECHDGKCHNGAPCSSKGGESFCDCGAADAVSSFAGFMCRDPAISYCGQGDVQNRGFCTNGGLCKVNLSVDSGDLPDPVHGGCHCPPEFEGPHCEYLKGFSPLTSKELHLKISAGPRAGDGPKAGAIATPIAGVGMLVGIVVSVIGAAAVAAIVWRAGRSRRELPDGRADEAPIRIRVMGEVESLEGDDGGYVDDDDLGSISECSLEEIELESPVPVDPASPEESPASLADSYRDYLHRIRNGGYETYFDGAPDFADVIVRDIIGPPADGRRA